MLFPLGSLPDGPPLDTKRALLLLDFQNDFVSHEGNLPAVNVAAFLPNLPILAARFRENGQVVWARSEYRDPCSTISPETGAYSVLLKQFVRQQNDYDDNTSGYATPHTDHEGSQALSEPIIEPDAEAFLAADLPEGSRRCCVPQSWGFQYPKEIESAIDRRKDVVITKSHYSAFADMSLVLQLRTRMVTDLYLCGSLSNVSVYATVLDAVRHGFGVTLIEDCLGYRDEGCHYEAMRQMADSMCAEGIDYQELMDDLAGILGDVIKEEDYTTRYQVDISRSTFASQSRTSQQQVNDWISSLASTTQQLDQVPESTRLVAANARLASSGSEGGDESHHSRTIRQRSSTIDSSPPRKRSTNDLEEPEEAPSTKLPNNTSLRRASHELAASCPDRRGKKTKVRVRRSVKDRQIEQNKRRVSLDPYAHSAGESSDNMPSPDGIEGGLTYTSTAQLGPSGNRRSRSKNAPIVFLGPNDKIGDGTSRVLYDVIDDAFAEQAFEILKTNVAWQKMYHRTGEVPRLVAVQGDVVKSSVDSSTTFPIYRHPADESPELLPFDATVDMLRQTCEQHVGHTLNHVLIQHYRNSEDNISEHSDKSLDIARGSNIVNLSLGAQRTMMLRTKRSDDTPDTNSSSVADSDKPSQPATARQTQRVHLPHNSLFVLSTSTNTKYLHAIRADKRPPCEKLPEELAFNGERISLTFRHIATYISKAADDKLLIWGQGAKGKSRQAAGPILSGDKKAEQQGEEMIIAFGKENHEGNNFDWDAVYGAGFDVLTFTVKPVDD